MNMWLIISIIAALICGAVGAWAGGTKGRPTAGFWLGFFFGPLGWITVLLMDRPEQPAASAPVAPAPAPEVSLAESEESMRRALRASRGQSS